MEQTPCNYKEGGTVKEPKLCGKVCDPGKSMCPRHDALRVAKLEKEIEKARRPGKRRATR
jgi:hypothetical protein